MKEPPLMEVSLYMIFLLEKGNNEGDRMATKFKIEQPKIPYDVTPTDFHVMDDEPYYELCIISDCSIIGEDIHRIRFEQVMFKNVTFIDVSFRNIELTDVIFEKCNLSNTDFSDAIIHRVEFKESKILGLNLSDATLGNVRFENCHANLSNFGFAKLKQVMFDSCSLCNVDVFRGYL